MKRGSARAARVGPSQLSSHPPCIPQGRSFSRRGPAKTFWSAEGGTRALSGRFPASFAIFLTLGNLPLVCVIEHVASKGRQAIRGLRTNELTDAKRQREEHEDVCSPDPDIASSAHLGAGRLPRVSSANTSTWRSAARHDAGYSPVRIFTFLWGCCACCVVCEF